MGGLLISCGGGNTSSNSSTYSDDSGNTSIESSESSPEELPEDKSVYVYDLTTEDLINPVGIDTSTPYFGWKMNSNLVGKKQTAYEIVVNDKVVSNLVEKDGIIYVGLLDGYAVFNIVSGQYKFEINVNELS